MAGHRPPLDKSPKAAREPVPDEHAARFTWGEVFASLFLPPRPRASARKWLVGMAGFVALLLAFCLLFWWLGPS
jgi:hypothetical protein